jgi:uncharacterized protein YceK
MKTIRLSMITCGAAILSGCSSVGAFFNPFYETPTEVAYLGQKNDEALNDSGAKGESAREALEAMGTYQRAHDPQPNNPVMMPAVVRLMWVPDHLNSHGDLVPAHYYYLKVKKDSWALTDSFELESQLGGNRGSSSSVGYVSPEEVR